MIKEYSQFHGGYTETKALAVAKKLGGTVYLWTPGAWVVIAPINNGQEIRGPGWRQGVSLYLPKTETKGAL